MTNTALERVRGLLVQHSWDDADLDEFDALVRDAILLRRLRGLFRSRLFQKFLEQGFWHAHHVDLVWRFNGEDVREEADWLKDVWYAIKPSGEPNNAG